MRVRYFVHQSQVHDPAPQKETLSFFFSRSTYFNPEDSVQTGMVIGPGIESLPRRFLFSSAITSGREDARVVLKSRPVSVVLKQYSLYCFCCTNVSGRCTCRCQ